jgi:hypothetical protein
MMRLVQFKTEDGARKVAMVEASELHVLAGVTSVYELAHLAIDRGRTLANEVDARLSSIKQGYRAIEAAGRVLAPIDHIDPYRMFVTGTGLTHIGSAALRSGFHGEEITAGETDSARLFRLGRERGKPSTGEVGATPEWFYKGTGHIVEPSGCLIEPPGFGQSINEEAEIAGIYVIGPDGSPLRLGFALANDVSDHSFEAQNYMYVAASKLRQLPLGPELLVDELPSVVTGRIAVVRAGIEAWAGEFKSGERNMTHSISNLEHHHFKHLSHRRPGDIHIHVFGCDVTSGGAGHQMHQGDEITIDVPCFGRPQRCVIGSQAQDAAPTTVAQL